MLSSPRVKVCLSQLFTRIIGITNCSPTEYFKDEHSATGVAFWVAV